MWHCQICYFYSISNVLTTWVITSDLAIKDISSSLPPNIKLYQWNSSNTCEPAGLGEKNLTELIQEAPSNIVTVREKPGYHDPLVYIYTSGTTGLPKAAVITNARLVNIQFSSPN